MSEEQEEKPGLVKKSSQRGPNLIQRGQQELARPGGLGEGAHGLIRRWFRKVWKSRGGGLYAVGFALSFLYFEIAELVFDDIPMLFSINLLSSDLLQFALQFVIDTLKNTLLAFMWPVWLIQWQSPIGIMCLAAGFFLFPRLIQKPMEHWLFEGQPPPPKAKKARKKGPKGGDE